MSGLHGFGVATHPIIRTNPITDEHPGKLILFNPVRETNLHQADAISEDGMPAPAFVSFSFLPTISLQRCNRL